MSNFFAKILYRKKVTRLEKLSLSLKFIGEGNLREAVKLTNQVRPTEYIEDLALYYFVKGRLALEMNEIEKGENYLMSAWAMGFRRGAIFVSLALAKARLRRFGEAQELLMIAGDLLNEDDDMAIINGLLDLMNDISSGAGKSSIDKLILDGAKKLTQNKKIKRFSEKEWASLLELHIKNVKERTVSETAIAILGEYMAQKHKGVWQFGLETVDHAVIINGVSFIPNNVLKMYYAGTIEFDEITKPDLRHSISNLYLEEEGI